MIAWTIKGEAGKAFDATVRSLEAAKIESAQVAFNSLADDTFTFSISPEAIPSATIPELKQKITLYREGVQFFVGTVTNVRSNIDSSSQQVQITVSGPWWWMERIGFTTNLQDGEGNAGERLSAVFGSNTLGQDLKTSIESAIDRAVVLGVPIANIAGGSSVAAMTAFPRITLNQSTIGQVLSELVRLVPDTMVYFDYSTSPVKLKVVRRPTADEVTFNASTDPITSIDINPIIDLEVSKVDLPYLTRANNGRTVFNVQSDGSGPNEQRQVLTVSGPELDTFLPNTLFDSVYMKIASLADAIGYTMAAGFIDKYLYNPISVTGTTFTSINYWSNGAGFTVNSYTVRTATYNKTGYVPVLFGEDFKANPPDWVVSQLGLIQVQVTGGIWGSDAQPTASWDKRIALNSILGGVFYKVVGSTYYTGKNFESDGPVIWIMPEALVSKYTNRAPGITKSSSRTTTRIANNVGGAAPFFNDGFIGRPLRMVIGDNWSRYWTTVTVTGYDASAKTFTHTSHPSGYAAIEEDDNLNISITTVQLPSAIVFRESDYSFISPPAGLASFLRSAQNWLPYEGSINLTQEDVGSTRYRGCKINISNSSSQFATMGALVASEVLDIQNGSTTINLGPAPRNDYRTIVDKIRKTSQDNIVYV